MVPSCSMPAVMHEAPALAIAGLGHTAYVASIAHTDLYVYQPDLKKTNDHHDAGGLSCGAVAV